MLQAGQLIRDRYQLQQKLGGIACRQTWLAKDLAVQPHRFVIVKFLAFAGEIQWEDLKLFEREAQTLQQLDCPSIPKYYDYFCTNEQPLWFGLVYEYIPGVSLQELLRSGKKFTEQQIRQIATETLNILIYLHELNPPVLHRDIKPSNLIWADNGQIYLIDFGTVQNQGQTGTSFTIVGSYGYTPIEQFGGKTVPASDIYALGATLIHLLTGIAPADLPQKDLQLQFSELVNISPHLLKWLQQAIAPAPERRFPTAQIALSSLKTEILPSPSTAITNNSGRGKLSTPIPAEIQHWNWGAFLLAPIWTLSNRVWIGLLTLVPVLGIWAAIAIGIKGNEWAWKSRHWESIEQFQRHQNRWTIAGAIVGISLNLFFWHFSFLLFLSILN